LLKAILPGLLILVPLQAFAQEQIMLEAPSDQGTFSVQIEWTPADIGAENTFEIRFIEPETGKEVEDVIYDFLIGQGGATVLERTGQTSNVQMASFSEPGPYTIVVGNIDGLGEGAAFQVQVTPEFSPAWVLPGAFAALFALRRKFGR
jgi:hypothetical protein